MVCVHVHADECQAWAETFLVDVFNVIWTIAGTLEPILVLWLGFLCIVPVKAAA